MPTYEYVCKACGEHIDVKQSVTDEPLSVCPSCGGALRKVFGSIGIAFKGSGFYRTDSRTAAKKEPKDKKQPAETKAGSGDASGKSEPKSDSKPKADSAKPSSAPKSDAKSA